MRLFHGSIERIETPRILPARFYRPLDFGTGFYTTTDFDQARRWVDNRLKHYPEAARGFVSIYEFDESQGSAFAVKKFDGVLAEWLRFIASNRLNYNVEHGYDIVIGPVANDRVYTVLNLFEGGYIDEENAIKRMKAYRLADQYLFHTERALSALRFVSSLEVSR